jgi:hypothetical protein
MTRTRGDCRHLQEVGSGALAGACSTSSDGAAPPPGWCAAVHAPGADESGAATRCVAPGSSDAPELHHSTDTLHACAACVCLHVFCPFASLLACLMIPRCVCMHVSVSIHLCLRVMACLVACVAVCTPVDTCVQACLEVSLWVLAL